MVGDGRWLTPGEGESVSRKVGRSSERFGRLRQVRVRAQLELDRCCAGSAQSRLLPAEARLKKKPVQPVNPS